MNLRLHAEDCRAIDLLLDHSAAIAGKPAGQSAFVTTDGLFRQRLTSGEKVLGLLDLMPVADPPRQLLTRTLRFVKDASGRDVTIHRNLTPPGVSSHLPVA